MRPWYLFRAEFGSFWDSRFLCVAESEKDSADNLITKRQWKKVSVPPTSLQARPQKLYMNQGRHDLMNQGMTS
jgi:hypothetical protein